MKVGDWVEVRQESEILRTLDARGALEGIRFMPEMLQFCGRRFRVFKSAHKTCDNINRQSRRLLNTVHLDTRCSGEAHGGCQAGCLLFWKEAWLRPLNSQKSAGVVSASQPQHEAQPLAAGCTRANLIAQCATEEAGKVRYRCQATHIREATSPLHWWDVRQYLRDLKSGNVTLRAFIRGLMNALWIPIAKSGAWPRAIMQRCYGHTRLLSRGAPFPLRLGTVPRGERTPTSDLNLRSGELVRVRPMEQIDRTLDYANQNRGLYFDPEQVPYAHETLTVLRRVDRIINEQTGEMLPLKAPTVVLDSVVCQGEYGSCRIFCPRSAYLFWREAWLERAEADAPRTTSDLPLA